MEIIITSFVEQGYRVELLIPILGIMAGIVIPLGVFVWLYFEGKGKRQTVLEISKHLNDPDKLEELLKIFENKVPEKLKEKCFLISKMSKKEQENIFGQKDIKLKDALNRKYTLPFLFKGNKNEKNKLLKVLNSNSLTLQEGGRVLNLCDNINKVKSMNRVIKILKKTEDKIKTIAVGDNYNDLDMLKSCDIPCLVFNDQFIQDQINIDNLIFSNKPSPEGWADVIKTALLKLDY